ncbi:MAG: hypothetical protein LBC88_08395 [Spirochaetaceae bacterium]|jgi:hypothetical protein|nr:hypothetical protein [Spirochaetaceae bacterium]
MEQKIWKAFCRTRDKFRAYTETLLRETPGLREAEERLVAGRSGPAYAVDTPVLYNFRMDGVTPKDRITLILVADNPGRREQAAENRRYLVGPSGKIAARFFREHPELGIDFERGVLILNKTPIHTPRTQELRELCRMGGEHTARAIAQSQQFMAELLVEFHRESGAAVWITGYSEMKRHGIFEVYTETLISGYKSAAEKLRESIFLFRHFSMNQFTVDLNRQREAGESAAAALERIGRAYRKRILGW